MRSASRRAVSPIREGGLALCMQPFDSARPPGAIGARLPGWICKRSKSRDDSGEKCRAIVYSLRGLPAVAIHAARPRVSIDPPPETETAIADVAAVTEPESMTPEQRAEAREYGRKEIVASLADRALDLAYLAVMAFFFARPLNDWLTSNSLLGGSNTLRLIVLLLIVIALHAAVSFPLSLYSGHFLEHQYGLSRQSLGRWLLRYAKRNALAISLGIALFVGLYWIIWLTGSWWWIVAAFAFFLVSVLLGQLVPVLILPLFHKIQRLDDEELARRMDRLAEGTGLSIEGVYRLELSNETVKANAMLAGLGRTRRVLLGDTLLENFSPDEIEVVLAHEIGHHVHGHIRKLIVAGALYSAAGFWVADRVLAAQVADYNPHTLPVYLAPMVMLIISVFSQVLEPLQNAISRRYERQCDRYALDRTGLKAAYLSAFNKLARLNKDDPEPNPIEVFLFHSHPPIVERLAMAERHGLNAG